MSSPVLYSLLRLMKHDRSAFSFKKQNDRQSPRPKTTFGSSRFQYPALPKFSNSKYVLDSSVVISSVNKNEQLPPRKITDSCSRFTFVSIDSSSFRKNYYPSSSLKRSRKAKIIRFLEFSSSACAVAGGSLLASNIEQSKYGFIILAFSSGQMLIASILNRQKTLIVYAASVFCFVDCLGIVRWVFQ
jgi:hypothetical protein